MRNLGLSVPSLALQLLSSAAVPGFFWNADENPLSLLMTGITHSRSSLAYMVDASGKYTTGPNNLATWSEDYSNAHWADAYNSNVTRTTSTANFTTSTSYVYSSVASAAVGSKALISVVLSSGSKTGTVGLRDVGSGTYLTVSLTPVPTRYYILATVTGVLQIGLDNRVGLGGDGITGTVNVSGWTVSTVTYETSPRPDDLVQTTSSAFYGLRCSYDTSTITYDGNNILTYSNDFANATWQKVAAGTGTVPALTPGSGPGPDGTPNAATTVVFNTGAGTSASDQSNIILNGGVTTPSGIKYLGGIWIKGSAGGKIQIRHQAAGPYTLWTLTGGWDRVFSVEDGLVTSAQFSVGLRQGVPSTINSSLTVQIAYATVSAVTTETAPRPQDQVITTSAPYYFMGGGLTFAPPTKRDLLIEDARTNYLGYSESPSNWALANCTQSYTANSRLGTLGVTTLTQTASGTPTVSFFAGTPSAVNGEVWTSTFELTGVGSKTMCYPALYGSVSVWGVNGDCTAKILSGPGSLSQTVGGLWQITGLSTSVPTVVSVTRTFRQSENIQSALYLQTGPAGTAGDQIKVACPQLEKGPYASSYTPTWSSATAVARGADICQFTGPAIAAIQGAAATVIVQTTSLPYSPGSNSSLVAAGAGNSVLSYVTNSNAVGAAAAATYNQTTALTSGTPDYTAPMRIGVSYSAAGRSLSVNGGAVVTDANSIGSIPSAYLGSNGSSLFLGGRLKSVAIFKSRLADPSLQARTPVGASFFQ